MHVYYMRRNECQVRRWSWWVARESSQVGCMGALKDGTRENRRDSLLPSSSSSLPFPPSISLLLFKQTVPEGDPIPPEEHSSIHDSLSSPPYLPSFSPSDRTGFSSFTVWGLRLTGPPPLPQGHLFSHRNSSPSFALRWKEQQSRTALMATMAGESVSPAALPRGEQPSAGSMLPGSAHRVLGPRALWLPPVGRVAAPPASLYHRGSAPRLCLIPQSCSQILRLYSHFELLLSRMCHITPVF